MYLTPLNSLIRRFIAIVLFLNGIHVYTCFAQESGKFYTDYRNNTVYIPLGDRGFVDYMVEFNNGTPASTGPSADGNNGLGRPDFTGEGQYSKHTSLGCGGSVIYKFDDNALIDVRGKDLYVFEVGISKEPTDVYISKDGTQWIYVGTIDGGIASIDIGEKVKPDDIFYYVKLVDLKVRCGDEPTKGADIDAVAAIGSMKITKSDGDRAIVYKDQIKTRANEITIQVWDNLIEDGDTITLKLNDQIILQHHRVSKIPKSFTIPLTEDDNDIIMFAENLGSQHPNTAAIRIFYGEEEKTLILNSDMNTSEAIKVLRR